MIRPYQPDDRAEWLRMRRTLWPEWPDDMQEAEMREMLERPELRAVLVHARPGGGLGGFIEVHIRRRLNNAASDRVAYVEGWYVDPDLRRQGVGQALMEAAEDWAVGRGLTEIASDTDIDNLASQQAHEKLGFEEVYRLVHYLKDL